MPTQQQAADNTNSNKFLCQKARLRVQRGIGWTRRYNTEDAVILGEASLILPIIMNMTLLVVDFCRLADVDRHRFLALTHTNKIVHALSDLCYVINAGNIVGFGRDCPQR